MKCNQIVYHSMQQEKCSPVFTQKSLDQFSTSPSLDYPQYLQTIRSNLEWYLPACNISIFQKINDQQDEMHNQFGSFSIIIMNPKIYKQKYQLFTQIFLDQNCYSFYVKHLLTVNSIPIKLQNRQMLTLSLYLCNKINTLLENFRIILHPLSGKIYFQTKSLINQSSLTHLKKNIPRQDCYYTEIILNSYKKAQKYMDLIFFLQGQVQLQQLINNGQLIKQFPFFQQSMDILNKLQKNLFYVSFMNINKKQQQENLPDNNFYQDFLNYANINNWKQLCIKQTIQNNQRLKYQSQKNQKKLNNLKQKIISNNLEYFEKNSQTTLQILTHNQPYKNIDFKSNPFQITKDNSYVDKTWKQNQKKSIINNKKILSYIEIVNQQNQYEYSENQIWKPISQGGFGIIELGNLKFKNLSSSFTEPETGFSFLVKQQMIRKRDKNVKKGKIQRQKKILQRLRYFNHPNIMSFYISFQSSYQNCIFSDYTPNLSLDIYLKKNQISTNLDRRIFFLIQAAEALQFLHSQNIIHLDIKPGNMLVSKYLKVQLSDFGEAFVKNEDDPVQHQHAYTIPYCAPQIFLSKPQLTQPVDVYAIGVCIMKVILGQKVFQTFLKRRFVKRLCKLQIPNFGLAQIHQKSFLKKITKIISLIAYKSISQASNIRPSISWIGYILTQCRNFICSLCY